MKRISGLILIFFLSTFAGLAENGLMLSKKITNSGMMARAGASSTSTVHITDSFIRTIASDGEETIVMIEEGKIVNIDHKKKRYAEITFEELNAQLEKASAQLSKEQNPQTMQMMEKMMGGPIGELSVEEEGSGGEIAGYATEKYTVNMSPLSMVLWAAPDLPIPDAYYDSMKLKAAPNPMFDMAKMFEEFKKIKGYPLKTETSMKMMGMEGKSIDEVTNVEKGEVPPVAIPQSYKKVPFGKL